jgi:hypothetical protein
MSLQTWQETLITSQVDGAALANSVTATSLLPAAAKFTLPANFFSAPGKALRVTAQGRISTTTGPPSFTWDIRLNNTVVWNGGAAVTVASVTNKSWELMVHLICRAIGSTGNLLGVGKCTSSAAVGSTGGNANTWVLPDSAPAVGSNIDTTTALQLDLFGTWSAASASNTITLHNFILEALN